MTRDRAARYAAAVLLGFGGTWLIGEAQHIAGKVRTDDRRVLLGGVDVFAYCGASLGATATAALVVQDASGWRCASVFGGIFETSAVDMDDACRIQHGDGAFSLAADRSSPYSWQCWRVVPPGGADQRLGGTSSP